MSEISEADQQRVDEAIARFNAAFQTISQHMIEKIMPLLDAFSRQRPPSYFQRYKARRRRAFVARQHARMRRRVAQ